MFDLRNRCATLRRLKAVKDLTKLSDMAPCSNSAAFATSSGETSPIDWSGTTPNPTADQFLWQTRCRRVAFILGDADTEDY